MKRSLRVALEREAALLSEFDEAEIAVLAGLLDRLRHRSEDLLSPRSE